MRKLTGGELVKVYGGGTPKDCNGKGGNGGSGSRNKGSGSKNKGSGSHKGSGSKHKGSGSKGRC
jgi:hypothetical protein